MEKEPSNRVSELIVTVCVSEGEVRDKALSELMELGLDQEKVLEIIQRGVDEILMVMDKNLLGC